ncbi:hypothetical protein SDC9_211663 [bioreactor metagenome]|uniref:Uncharacterized protein n=1 Tax=bioreactor metagenome TaxID=1076179 RepID=A0A645JKF0_9ZZZZ
MQPGVGAGAGGRAGVAGGAGAVLQGRRRAVAMDLPVHAGPGDWQRAPAQPAGHADSDERAGAADLVFSPIHGA